ncbi:hypothetical protein HGRIS_008802 [Hohenbuehelia grisea]|uniref:Uncharacterized protein n=1 Tax=Hohenbuehelia grisea TaxID=104357 RepID=A0ABR3J9G7_9AGAR
MKAQSELDLSLRHLPDVSDASLSFQIPETAFESHLLTERDDDFMHAAEATLAFFGEPTPLRKPLTLSQLTPDSRHHQHQSSPQAAELAFPPPSHLPLLAGNAVAELSSTPNIPQSSKRHLDSRYVLSNPGSFESLTAKTKPPADVPETLAATPTGVDTSITASNQSGVSQQLSLVRIKKNKPKPVRPSAAMTKPRSTQAKDEPSESIPTQSSSRSTISISGATARASVVEIPRASTANMTPASDPTAERLLMSSQKYADMLSSESPSENYQPHVVDHDVLLNDEHRVTESLGPCETRQNCHDGPLTVSQLSPSKRNSSPSGQPSPSSPMRSSTKRTLPAAGPSQNKRSRLSTRPRLSNTVLGRAKPLSTSGSALGSQRHARPNTKIKVAASYSQARFPRTEGSKNRFGTSAKEDKASPASTATSKSAKENVYTGALSDLPHDSVRKHVGRARQPPKVVSARSSSGVHVFG